MRRALNKGILGVLDTCFVTLCLMYCVIPLASGKHTVKHVLHTWTKQREEARTLGMFGLHRAVLRMFVGVLVSQGREYWE